jgi:hypothetical protein
MSWNAGEDLRKIQFLMQQLQKQPCDCCNSLAASLDCEVNSEEMDYLDLDTLPYRDPVGDCAVAGDLRWAGTFGVNIDFVARTHCSVAHIAIDDIRVNTHRP